MDYKHYIRTNEENSIVKVFSTAFEEPDQEDILICETDERHFNKIDGKYIFDSNRIPNFKYNNKIVEMTEQEKQNTLEYQNKVEQEKQNQVNVLIEAKKTEIARQQLIDEGVLDSDGNLKKK